MATTTRYGWTTPDDTDPVADGASAIRSVASAIDSDLQTVELFEQSLSNQAATGSAATWDTALTITDPGHAIHLWTQVTSQCDIADGINTIPQLTLQVSMDGGSTYGTEQVVAGGLHRSGSGLRVQRCSLTALGVKVNETPTGDIVIRARITDIVGIGGNTSFENGKIAAMLVRV